MGPFQQRAQAPCRDCGGTGVKFRESTSTEVLEVHIPKGSPSGHKLKFNEKGNEIPDGDAGDVIIELQEQPHGRFKRKGDDLYIERTISLSDALCGFALELDHLDGRKILVQSAPGDVVRPVNYDPLKAEAEEKIEWEVRQLAFPLHLLLFCLFVNECQLPLFFPRAYGIHLSLTTVSVAL